MKMEFLVWCSLNRQFDDIRESFECSGRNWISNHFIFDWNLRRKGRKSSKRKQIERKEKKERKMRENWAKLEKKLRRTKIYAKNGRNLEFSHKNVPKISIQQPNKFSLAE